MLILNRLSGFGAFAVGAAPTIEFLSSSLDTTNASSYTFSSVSLGDADSTRRIIVAAHSANNTAQETTSVTVAGVSATKVVEQLETNQAVSLWIAEVPIGTSGDIVISYGTSVNRCGFGAWRVLNLRSSTAEDTTVSAQSNESNDLSLSGLSKSAAIVACGNSESSPDFSYSGTSLDYNYGWSDVTGSHQEFAGSHGQTSDSGSFSITQTTTGGNKTIGVAAGFR